MAVGPGPPVAGHVLDHREHPTGQQTLGGGAPDELSEAEVARRDLTARGLATGPALHLEASSRDTLQNLRNARDMLPPTRRVTLLSSRPELAVVGESVPHEAAALHVTGHALYTDDLVGRTSGVLHAHPVQAPHTHARVTRLDPAPAYAVPGVVRVLTAADVPGVNDAGIKHDEPLFPSEVMYHGHSVAWVLGETLEAARRGALAVEVDYEPLPSILTVEEAIADPHDLSNDLVNAQQARRALDYLVGFNLSPLLWKKIRPGLSAGRVQSPALRLIVERDDEIAAFVPREYWTIDAELEKDGRRFPARLVAYAGEKLEQFTLHTAAQARARPRVVMSFHQKRDSLRLSGLLVSGEELAGRPAVLDAPVGQGHVVLFAIRPFWRWESQGSFALVFNTIMNWNDLNVAWPAGLKPSTA